MTLTEVIVGAIILLAITAGLYSTFINVKRYIIRAGFRSISIQLIRHFFDQLLNYVDYDIWNDSGASNPLYPHGVPVSISSELQPYLVNRGFDAYVTVENVSGHDFRRVYMTMNYPTK